MRFPICRDTFREADDALGESLSTLCFEGPEERLLLTENTQPAILAVSVAVYRLVDVDTAIEPSFAAGHSLGEYSAHVAAGTLSFADALRTVRRRGRYMQEAVPVGEGAMAAILGLDAAIVGEACEAASVEARRGRHAGQPQRAGAGRDCRACGRGGARRRAGEGARRQAGDSAGRQRAVPLRAHEAGGGAAGAGAARARRRMRRRIPVVANVDARAEDATPPAPSRR